MGFLRAWQIDCYKGERRKEKGEMVAGVVRMRLSVAPY